MGDRAIPRQCCSFIRSRGQVYYTMLDAEMIFQFVILTALFETRPPLIKSEQLETLFRYEGRQLSAYTAQKR